MEKIFNSVEFLNRMSKELVDAFINAGSATTPTTVGAAREHVVREKLGRVLPANISVGSGFVIDSFQHTSKQTDIIIYEKDICPVFSIANTPETTYYPCESVLAVGEVKSTLDTDDIEDAFRKIESVKSCQRYVRDSLYWRKYCNTFSTLGAESERFDQNNKWQDQIYGFIICQTLGLEVDSFLKRCLSEMGERDKALLPNIVVSLSEGFAIFLDDEKKCHCIDAHDANMLFFFEKPSIGFQFLLSRIHIIMSNGRTSNILPFDRYILESDKLDMVGKGIHM
jgi:hypothetical protein